MRDQDTVLGCGGHIQVGQAPADDGDQLRVRQSLDEGAWQRHSLPKGAEHVEGAQLLGGLVLRQVPVEGGDVRAAQHRGPVSEVERDTRVVVEDCHPWPAVVHH